MLEEDYLSKDKNRNPDNRIFDNSNINNIGSQIIRQIILPELEREVNEGQNFALLRQIYSGMILATWYKRTLKESILGKIYANKAKVRGVNQDDPKANEETYQQYLKAFKQGVFNYIKEDVDKYTQQAIPRKYFSGGTKGYDDAQIAVFGPNKAIPANYRPIEGQLSGLDKAQVVLHISHDSAMKAQENVTTGVFYTDTINRLMTGVIQSQTNLGNSKIRGSIVSFFVSTVYQLENKGKNKDKKDSFYVMQAFEVIINFLKVKDLKRLFKNEIKTFLREWLNNKNSIFINDEHFLNVATNAIYNFHLLGVEEEQEVKDRNSKIRLSLLGSSFLDLKRYMQSYQQVKQILKEDPHKEQIVLNPGKITVFKLNPGFKTQEIYINGTKLFLGYVDGKIAVAYHSQLVSADILHRDVGTEFANDAIVELVKGDSQRVLIRNKHKVFRLFILTQGELTRPVYIQEDLIDQSWKMAVEYLNSIQGQEFLATTLFSESDTIRTLTYLILDKFLENEDPSVEIIKQLPTYIVDEKNMEAIIKKYEEYKNKEKDLKKNQADRRYRVMSKSIDQEAYEMAYNFISKTDKGEEVANTLWINDGISWDDVIRIMKYVVLEKLLKKEYFSLEAISIGEVVNKIRDRLEAYTWQEELDNEALLHSQSTNKISTDTDKALLSKKDLNKNATLNSNNPTKGGIDLNSNNLNLLIKRDGQGVILPLADQDLSTFRDVQGFYPVILEIQPATNLPIFKELMN